MEQVCARCARLGLRPRSTVSSAPLAINARGFSSSRVSCDEGDQKPSRWPSGRPLSGPSLRGALDRNTASGSAARPQSRPAGTILRRTATPRIQNPGPAGTATRSGTATGAGAGAGSRAPLPPGRLLQRTGAPRQSQQPVARRTAGRGQQPLQAQRRDQPRSSAATGKHTDRRVRRLVEKTKTSLAEEEDSSALAAEDLPSRVEHYINTIVDPPVNPTTELPHVPGKDLSVSELRKDWPNTPLSNSGLVESVQQRIEWLAHRIPHGYQTPGQLAEWYTKGYFTRFESESEKEEVLKLAQEMARAEADKETEKTNVEVQPKDMEFDDVVTRAAERKGLADTYVRGVYPEVKKQKMPFLDQIVRNLNNNATFPHGKTEQFMQTVQRVIVSRA
ncbi:uncharacterized protein Z519_01206 [Cladophialophora bantiana CBS 173.52]|uniref:Uncharacterized protein n=1 Tax=Cladophialophora bantiana (strain ATCC 10958 / CBS 173.52 / CDC B-1940 / NIH 8579) TaxID=1442370 RepID=A0A0D2GGZ2_CLAB1|nr:uncharacterized protein Z519_01206 [Cladophialophora bantiana CBS 173.52]KIW97622.1 hypothetical protein Z519_01206 [Cladophialophora bantiana CBS 173.52]